MAICRKCRLPLTETDQEYFVPVYYQTPSGKERWIRYCAGSIDNLAKWPGYRDAVDDGERERGWPIHEPVTELQLYVEEGGAQEAITYEEE